MRRREFITLVGGTAVAWPLAARAQQDQRVRRIGVLMGDFPENNPEARAVVAAFREELQKLGWTEGRNVRIDTRWAAADIEAMQRFAKELVGSQPELIFSTNTPATATLLQQTRTIPIVFVQVTDPVGSGFVASIPRPGGNVTGFITMEPTMAGKWLEMLKEVVPTMRRVAVMQNPEHPAWEAYLRAITAVAPALGVEVMPAPVHNAAEIERALEAFARIPNGGLVLLPSHLGATRSCARNTGSGRSEATTTAQSGSRRRSRTPASNTNSPRSPSRNCISRLCRCSAGGRSRCPIIRRCCAS
jgi:putative tryptophan/tyrosine transport system substrate-binding protein